MMARNALLGWVAGFAIVAVASAISDWRWLQNGYLALQDVYLDQPYCVTWVAPTNASDARWVCTITRNNETEGHYGEHTEVMVSRDKGVTWETGIRLEPAGSFTNAYGTIFATSFGRIYVIYNMNVDGVHAFPNGTAFARDDELGFAVTRWSDDGGLTWSANRLQLPMRTTAIDVNNTFEGTSKMFWSVDQVKVDPASGRTYHAFTKVGTYMQIAPEETWFWSSPNILTEQNASAVTWDMWPDGDVGVTPPPADQGKQWEEGHLLQLAHSTGFFSFCRTNLGYLGAASTNASTPASGWTPGHFMTYSGTNLPAASGRPVKNPEGPITMKRFSTGQYLLLYYFNSFPGYSPSNAPFSSRNPYWLSTGWEEEGEIKISQPEVVLHDYTLLDTMPGYPDFIEDASAALDASGSGDSSGSFSATVFITETNKTHARVHPVDPAMLALLWSQQTITGVAQGNLTLQWPAGSQGKTFSTPPLPVFGTYPHQAYGLTIGMWLTNHSAAAAGEQLLVVGSALRLSVVVGSAVQLTLADAAGVAANVTTDSECTARLLAPGAAHYLAAIVDAGAHILTLSVDGVVCDGSVEHEWGWSWIPSTMGDLNTDAAPTFSLGGSYRGTIAGGHWYSRYLYNTEVIGNWRAGAAAATAPVSGR